MVWDGAGGCGAAADDLGASPLCGGDAPGEAETLLPGDPGPVIEKSGWPLVGEDEDPAEVPAEAVFAGEGLAVLPSPVRPDASEE